MYMIYNRRETFLSQVKDFSQRSSGLLFYVSAISSMHIDSRKYNIHRSHSLRYE